MKRRRFLLVASALVAGGGAFAPLVRAASEPTRPDKVVRSEAEWRKLLTPQQFDVLRNEGTERPGSSPLNSEKRKGTYTCAACHLPLFASDKKYESGTGWPSYFEALPDGVNSKTDYKLLYPRTEYHCARCGGHQGHIFKDGPRPTGLRYCNNGVALKFVPA